MNEKNKNILLAILIVGVLAMTVAFAALTTRLKIQGQANVSETKWNIYFDNWALDTQNTVIVDGKTQQNTSVYPTINELTKTLQPYITKIDNLNVTLKQPNDYAKYTFEIVNKSTMNATLSVFNTDLTCNDNKNCSHISYTVNCLDKDNQTVTVGSSLEVDERIYCTLEVKYKDQTNTTTPGSNQKYTQEEVSATLSADFQYIQESDVFTYRTISGDSSIVPNNVAYYLKINKYTNNKEVCGVYSVGTACIESNKWDGFNGDYISRKIIEFTDAGAHCYRESDWEVCSGSGGMWCQFNPSGGVYCADNNGSCTVQDYGAAECR